MKKCPFCAEEIQEEAIVCRYCGRELPEYQTQVPNLKSAVPTLVDEKSRRKPNEGKKYRPYWLMVLTFLFVFPIWVYLVLSDQKQDRSVRVFASFAGAGYLIFCCLPIAFFALSPDNMEVKSASNSPSQDYIEDYLVIRNTSAEQLSFGPVKISGIVTNNGSRSLRFVRLRGRIYSRSGEQINTDFGFIDSDVLEGGKTSTFIVYVDNPNRELVTFDVSIESARLE